MRPMKSHRYIIRQRAFSKAKSGSNSFKTNSHIVANEEQHRQPPKLENHKGYESDPNVLDKTFNTTRNQPTVAVDNWEKFIVYDCTCKDKKKCTCKTESENPSHNRFIWTSDNDDKVDQESAEHRKDNSKVIRNSKLLPNFEFDLKKATDGSKQKFGRARVNSEPFESPQKPKKSFHLSHIKAATSKWEENLNLSLNAQLGEAQEHSNHRGENNEENVIQDDPDFFYASIYNNPVPRDTFKVISKLHIFLSLFSGR